MKQRRCMHGAWLGGHLVSAMVVSKPTHLFLDELEIPYYYKPPPSTSPTAAPAVPARSTLPLQRAFPSHHPVPTTARSTRAEEHYKHHLFHHNKESNPEVVVSESNYTTNGLNSTYSTSDDVYSFGVLLLELVSGRPTTFDDTSLVELSQELITSNSKLRELVEWS